MPEFMLTGPDGKSYKLTTPDGVTHEDAERELARTMTHQAEQPNPAEPYLKGARDFAKGGVSDVLRGAGVQMPQASNAVGDLLKSDAANTAIGMVNPIKGPFRPNQFKVPRAAENSNVGDLVDRVGNKIPYEDNEFLVEAMRSHGGDIQKTLDGFRESYANYPRPERLEQIAILEAWKRRGAKLGPDPVAVLGAVPETQRLPQPPTRQRIDRPLNQQTLDEMRAAPPEPPPGDPRPINPETLAEMRASDPLGTGPLSQTDPLLSK